MINLKRIISDNLFKQDYAVEMKKLRLALTICPTGNLIQAENRKIKQIQIIR